MNAREKFIEQVKPLLETPHAQWTKAAREASLEQAKAFDVQGRNICFFIYGWEAAIQEQDLRHGKTDTQKERNYRSFAFDCGQQWLANNLRPAERGMFGVKIPSQELVLKHKTGHTRYNLVLDFNGLTEFIKRLGRMPVSRFV